MPVQIPLQAIPNQSIANLRLSDSVWDITIKEANGYMAVDIVRDNVILQTGARVVSGEPLLPYAWQEKGNFVFTTSTQEVYPYYTNFSITQFLIYTSPAELLEIQNAS